MGDFNLAAELAIGLAESRRDAESRMTDRCTIRRIAPVTDRVTGDVTYPGVPVYDGPCRVVDAETVVSSPEAGGATFTVRRVRVDLPVSAAEVVKNDVVTVTASATYPFVARLELRVVYPSIGTQTTARRLTVEGVS